MVTDEEADGVDVVVVEAESCGDLPAERLADLAVVADATLADVVQQRGEDQQVGPWCAVGQRGRLGAALEQVTVDGVAVEHVALGQAPHGLPLRQ